MERIEILALSTAAEGVVKALENFKGNYLPLFASFAEGGGKIISPGQRIGVPTGISISMPDGFEGQILSDDHLSSIEGVVVLNSPGTIDPDFRGEVSAIMINMSSRPVEIRRGMIIAKMRFSPFTRVLVTEVDELAPSARGESGLGSTGAR